MGPVSHRAINLCLDSRMELETAGQPKICDLGYEARNGAALLSEHNIPSTQICTALFVMGSGRIDTCTGNCGVWRWN